MTKNIGKSIRTRLLNLAKEEKQEYMKVLFDTCMNACCSVSLQVLTRATFSERQFAIVCLGWVQGSSNH